MPRKQNWQEVNLKRRYGITLEEYNKLAVKQDNACAICRVCFEDLNRKAHVDHCHITGKVRGLLCSRCNQSLHLLERPHLLEAVEEYLGVKIERSAKVPARNEGDSESDSPD